MYVCTKHIKKDVQSDKNKETFVRKFLEHLFPI